MTASERAAGRYVPVVYVGDLTGDALARALGEHLIINRASLRDGLRVAVPWTLGGSPAFAASGALLGPGGVAEVVYDVAVPTSEVDEVWRRLGLIRDHLMASTPIDAPLPTVWLLLPSVAGEELHRCGSEVGRRGYYLLHY